MTVALAHDARHGGKVPAGERTLAIVISHTHWDREWYLTQKQFQFLLGDTFDAIIDALEHEPGFTHFMADGQTSLIHDYLEIRPARRAQVLRLIQQQRLTIGPWYTMPDLWLPSGEALIRNLLRGRLDCERLGAETQQAGYVPDSFGHIEQMPQILNGFGISTYFFSRGKAEHSLPGEMAFTWIGPDDQSRVTAHHLPSGYGNAVMLPSHDADSLKSRLETILRPYIAGRDKGGPALLLNGFDHVWVQRELPRLLAQAGALVPDVEFVMGTLQSFIAAHDEHVAGRELPHRRGCLRDPNLLATHLHGTWSSRIDNKLANGAASAVLEGLAEPAAAMLLAAGGPNRRTDLALAWESVLLNHAHDSICGCSMDAVHADVGARFRHAEELAEMVIGDAMSKFAGEPARPTLVRMAGLGGAGNCCELLVDSGSDHPLAVAGAKGAVYPTQSLGIRKLRRHDCLITETGEYETNRGGTEFYEHRLLALIPEASPLEVQRLDVVPAAGKAPAPSDKVLVSANSIENRFIRVDVLTGGVIRMLHKPSGQVFDRLLELLDAADVGGGYMFKPLASDAIERSSKATTAIDIIEQGPIRGALGISSRWLLPASLNASKDARLGERVACDVRMQISLESDEDQLNCRLEFANRAIEHRVRLNLPLPFKTDRVNVERAFVVADEDLGRFTAEPGQNTHPMRNWVAATAEAGGLAFVGSGLHEYSVEDSGDNSDLRITLMRSVPFVDVCGAWKTPDAELRRDLAYQFTIIPFAGDWRSADIAARAHRSIHRSAAEVFGGFRVDWDTLPHATVRIEEQRGRDWIITSSHRSTWRKHFGERDGWRRRERLPHHTPAARMLTIKGDQVFLSCVKPAERASRGGDDGSGDLIVRCYSLARDEQEVTIKLAIPIAGAWECDLAETAKTPLERVGSEVRFNIRPFQIFTIRLERGNI